MGHAPRGTGMVNTRQTFMAIAVVVAAAGCSDSTGGGGGTGLQSTWRASTSDAATYFILEDQVTATQQFDVVNDAGGVATLTIGATTATLTVVTLAGTLTDTWPYTVHGDTITLDDGGTDIDFTFVQSADTLTIESITTGMFAFIDWTGDMLNDPSTIYGRFERH